MSKHRIFGLRSPRPFFLSSLNLSLLTSFWSIIILVSSSSNSNITTKPAIGIDTHLLPSKGTSLIFPGDGTLDAYREGEHEVGPCVTG